MAKRYYISLKAVILDGDKVLLIQKPNGRWDIPGGRLEPDQTPKESLLREVVEEIGVNITVGDMYFCDVRQHPKDPPVFAVFYPSKMDFAVEDIKLSHEHKNARVYKLSEISDLKMDKTYKRAIRKLKALG